MSTVAGKIKEAITRPEKVVPYLRKVWYAYATGIKNRDLSQAVDTTGGILLGKRFLEWRYGDSAVKDIQGSEMRLDIDETLGQELIIYGIREPVTTRAYQAELRKLKDTVEGKIVVLEIGANIGYYALMAAERLGNQAEIYAIEPEPSNYERLLENIERNGYHDRIQTHQLAIGLEDGVGTLQILEKGNLNRLSNYPVESAVDSIEVEINTVDRFLSDQEIPPESVNAVRMDLENLECDLLIEMDDILSDSRYKLLQIELHTGSKHLEHVLESLESNGLVIQSAARNNRPLDINSYGEISRNRYTELVLVGNGGQ